MDKNESQIISGVIGGNAENFKVLLDKHLKPVYNFVRVLMNGAPETDDVTQETFIKAWKNLKKFDPERNFRTWVLSIARNTAIDWMRKKKELPFSYFEDEEGNNPLFDKLADDEPLPDEILAKSREKEYLENILKKMPLIYREVLVLRYSENFSLSEISEMLSTPLNTVKSRHLRALAALRAELLRTK